MSGAPQTVQAWRVVIKRIRRQLRLRQTAGAASIHPNSTKWRQTVTPDMIGTVGLGVALLAAPLGRRSRRRPRGLTGLVGMLCLGVLAAVGMLYAAATGGITAPVNG
jgi:hypothetical protein